MDIRIDRPVAPPPQITISLTRLELITLASACRNTRGYAVDKLTKQLVAACLDLRTDCWAAPITYIGAPPVAHKD